MNVHFFPMSAGGEERTLQLCQGAAVPAMAQGVQSAISIQD
jgi:hypothetical protein